MLLRRLIRLQGQVLRIRASRPGGGRERNYSMGVSLSCRPQRQPPTSDEVGMRKVLPRGPG